MNEIPSPDPLNPAMGDEPSEAGPTIDLDLAEFEDVNDLQDFADQVAQATAAPGEDEASVLSQAELEESLFKARTRIAELEKQEAEHKDRHHRLQADYANLRNRMARETQLAINLSEKKLFLELLPVLDSFERCLASSYTSVSDFQDGISLIHKQFQEALRKAGVEGVDVKVGDPFDAQHAEALTTTTLADLPDGVVAAVYERGFMLRDHLLRPARVIVNHLPGADE